MQITIGLRVLQGVAKDSWQTLEQGPIKEGPIKEGPVKEGPVKTVSADTSASVSGARLG
jgi:hypothetical protein